VYCHNTFFGVIVFIACCHSSQNARTSLQYADDMERLKPALALNVAVTLRSPVLVAPGIIWQHILSFD